MAQKFKANGDPTHPPVYLTGSDGYPVAGRADQHGGGGSGAENLLTTQQMIFALIVVFVSIMFF